MKHLSEDELLDIQYNNKLDTLSKSHYDHCLYCQSIVEQQKIADEAYSNFLEKSSIKNIDIRQNVFNKLEIDFVVSDSKDYFNEVAISLFVIGSVLSWFYYPISIDFSSLYKWIPADSLKSMYLQYKLPFLALSAFVSLYFIDKFRSNFSEQW